MPLNGQLFRRSMAEALSELLAQKYPTAKHLARGVKIDLVTARNLRKGHLSVTTLQKVMAAEGRALWNLMGDELFGETYNQYEARRIAAAVAKLTEAEGVRSNLVRLRTETEELLAGAGLLDASPLGRAPGVVRREESRSWSRDDQDGGGEAEGARPDAQVTRRAFDGGER